MITIHAPSANFVAMTTTVTSAVTAAPTPLSAAFKRHLPSRHRNQCRTIPACARVKAVKTPITYRWMSELTFAPNAMIRAIEKPARIRIPFE